MICPTCRGRQFISVGAADDAEVRHVPCPDCIGGVAYCCDPEPPDEAERERAEARRDPRQRALF